MDKKTYFLGILTLTAVALLIANVFLTPGRVTAGEAVANDDIQAVTARTNQGGDALYLLDHDTGKLAVFAADQRGFRLLTVQNVEEGFDARGAKNGK